MSEREELDLLLDLLSLYKRYGIVTINSLDDKLKNPIADESIIKLFNILKNRDIVIKILTNQKYYIERIRVMTEKQHTAFMNLYKDLLLERIYLSSDLWDFAKINGLDLPQNIVREDAIKIFLNFLINQPDKDLDRILNVNNSKGFSKSSLGGWAEVILRDN